MTKDEFVARAKELRQIADQAEHEHLEFLLWGESQEELWQGSGLDYTSFLERNNLCKTDRYIRYRRVRTGYGLVDLKNVGMEAILAAATFKDKKDQGDLIDEAKLWEKTNETSISSQSAGALARDLKQRKAGQHAGHKNYATVVAENDRLRAEVKQLRTENMVLRAEVKKLKKVKKDAPTRPQGKDQTSPK